MKNKIKFNLLFSVLLVVLLLILIKPSDVFAEAECQPGEADVCENLGTCPANGSVCAAGHKYCVWDPDGNHYWGGCSTEVDTCGEPACQGSTTPSSPAQPPAPPAPPPGEGSSPPPAPAQPSCNDDARYCENGIFIYKHGGAVWESDNQCHYLFDNEGPCDQSRICDSHGGVNSGAMRKCVDHVTTTYFICKDEAVVDYPQQGTTCDIGGPCSDHQGIKDQTDYYCFDGKKRIHYGCKDSYGYEETTDIPCNNSSTSNPPPPPAPPSGGGSSPPPAPTVSPEYTTKYQVAYDNRPTAEAEWGSELNYTDNIKVSHTFSSTPGDKFIFVKFKTNKGKEVVHQLKITLVNPLPATTNNVTCASGSTYSGNEVTINWSGTSVTRAEIAGDHFSTIKASSYPTNYYQKNVSGTSTSAPTGFTKADGSGRTLTLTTGNTLYVRACNNTRCSPETTFSVPACAGQ